MEHRDVLPVGTILDGKYRIDRLIGAGGFGMTYEALDIGLNMKVAVKEYYPAGFGMREGTLTVRPRTTNDADLFNRLKDSFLREARTLAQLRHPCIVRVLSVFEGHGTAYMIMEFEQGKSLKGWLEGLGRKPKQAELDAIVMPLTDALEMLHAASFLHRDIAPDNIIVRADGSPVLLDFGAARRVMAELSGALTGIVKSGYSPQEQYANDPRAQGPWSDIYALGATLYRCVTGETPAESTLRMLDDPMAPASVKAAGSGYRTGFLEAIDRAMRLRPKERPQTIAEMRALLKDDGKTRALPSAATRVATAVAGGSAAKRDSNGWSAVAGAPAAPQSTPGSRTPFKIAAVVAGLVALGGMAWGGYEWRSGQLAETQRIEAERVRAETLAKEKAAADRVQSEKLTRDKAALDRTQAERQQAEQKAAEDQKRRELEQRVAEAERLKREEADRQKQKQLQPAGGGDKLAVRLDDVLGPCPFCDDIRKLVSAEEYAELTSLPLAVERTIAEARNRRGPQEDAAARAILEQIATIDLEPDPWGTVKPGQAKCTTYYFGFLDNGAQRVGTHQCMVRMVQIGGELTSLTVEKITGDGFHANIKKFRVNAPAYLGRTYLKGHAVTRYNLATPRNKENTNFGNKVGLLISLGGKAALISTNQNGFTKADDTFFEVIVLE